MKLKKRIKSLSEVDEKYHALYAQEGDEYVLQVDVEGAGGDDNKLQEELDRFKAKHAEAEKHRRAAEQKVSDLESSLTDVQKQMDELKNDGHRKNGDVEALEKSWQEKLDKQKQASQKEVDELKDSLQTMLVDNVAHSMASEISTTPEIILPHIRSRLKADYENGKPVTKVVDSNGEPSALTVDELKNEFIANEKFAPIITGSKASGSGAQGGSGSGAAGKTFDQLSGSELKELREKNPQEYERLRDEYYNSEQ